tara:strand:+ start:210 stop:764 length:555 start_codon:yes stop_codon:yes gene_type:complete
MTGYQSKKAAAQDKLAQPEQEPVGKFAKFTDGIWREVTNGSAGVQLYTTPPQRTEQEPMHPEIKKMYEDYFDKCFSESSVALPENFMDALRFDTAMRDAAPAQEPVAWVCYGAPGKRDIDFEEADINGLPIGTSLYTTPPQRTWVGLTDEEVMVLNRQSYDAQIGLLPLTFYRAIEAKLKERNT